jgi:hypothetical protein
MSAPNPGPAESEGTTTPAPEAEGQEQQQTEQTTADDGLAAIRARMDEMAAQQEQLVQMFTPSEEGYEEDEEAAELYDEDGDLIEQAYVQQKYAERVQSERSSHNDRGVVLESAQGSRPSEDHGIDWGDRVLKAAERLRPQI